MDIDHDTSFRFIMEDDSISLASKIHVHFCPGKGAGLWLVVKPSIHSFHIAHFHLDPSEMSCMLLLEKVGMLYGESGGTPLCQKFHYKSIFT